MFVNNFLFLKHPKKKNFFFQKVRKKNDVSLIN